MKWNHNRYGHIYFHAYLANAYNWIISYTTSYILYIKLLMPRFYFPQKTLSISYKILQMRVLYTNPYRDTIVPSYVDAHRLKKGRGRPLLDEVMVFQLHRIRPWGHRIGSLEWLQLHSISPAIILLDAQFDCKRPFYTVVSRESKELLVIFDTKKET